MPWNARHVVVSMRTLPVHGCALPETVLNSFINHISELSFTTMVV